MGPLARAQARTHFVEVRRARQRRQDGEPRLMQPVPIHKVPQPLEIRFLPGRVYYEISCDAVADPSRNLDCLFGLADGRVLDQSPQPVVAGRLEAEEDIELAGDRTPCLEQLRVTGDRIDPALHEHPGLPDSAFPERVSQLEAAGGVIPEQ